MIFFAICGWRNSTGFPSVWQRAFPDGIAQLAGGCGRNLVHILDRYHRIRQHFFELCQNGRLVNYRIRCLPDQQQPGFVLRFLPELERAHARHRAQQLPDNITVDQRAIVPQKQIIFSPLDMRE